MKLAHTITGIQHLGIVVTDVNQAVSFYCNKLGFRLIHRKVVMETMGSALEAAFVQLGDMVIELFKPAGAKHKASGLVNGTIDHFAIDAPDFEQCADMGFQRGLKLHASTPEGSVWYKTVGSKGVKGINFCGLNNEVIEFCHDYAKDYGIRSGLQGWSHLALKVRNLNDSIAFYESLGFQKCADGYLDTLDGRLLIGFVELNGFQIEIIQTLPDMQSGLENSGTGSIDHFALDVRDIQQAFYACRQEGYDLITPVIKELSLFEHGIRYFLIQGPDNEVIEFNQKISFKNKY